MEHTKIISLEKAIEMVEEQKARHIVYEENLLLVEDEAYYRLVSKEGKKEYEYLGRIGEIINLQLGPNKR